MARIVGDPLNSLENNIKVRRKRLECAAGACADGTED